MEENLQEQSTSCSVNSKKCCTKGIIVLVVCCLISFFAGYYFGSKQSVRNFRPTRTRAMNQRMPSRIPSLPRISNPQRVQRPPVTRVQPNIPNRVQRPKIQSQNAQKNPAATLKKAPSTTKSKKK